MRPDQSKMLGTPSPGRLRRTISRNGVALEAWTGTSWLPLKIISMQEHWADPIARPGHLIVEVRAEVMDVDLDNPAPDPAQP